MASNIQVKTKSGGTGPGAPASLLYGELAYNPDGNSAVATDINALYAGNFAGASIILVGPSRQMELTGDQTAAGAKTFSGTVAAQVGFSTGVGGTNVVFPIVRGTANQVLAMNAGATALTFANAVQVVTRTVNIPNGGLGSVEDNFNAVIDWNTVDPTIVGPEFVVANGEVWTLNDLESEIAYLWIGSTGSFGTAAGGTPAVSTDFSAIGSVTQYATAAEVQLGTVDDKAIAPNVAASDLFRTQVASGTQTVNAATIFAAGSTLAINRATTFGAAGAGVTISAPDATLTGAASNLLTLDNCSINGGTW
jgi:hypothetical protein